MSLVSVTLRRVGACTFEAHDGAGNRVRTGGSAELAQQIRDAAPDPDAFPELPPPAAPAGAMRPTALLLVAFGACSAIDVVLILAKQRQDLRRFEVVAEGERPDTTPAPFTRIALTFTASGVVDPERLARAAKLAVEKYCSVGDSLSSDIAVEIRTEVVSGI